VYDDPASLARVTRAMRRAATSLAVRGAGADAAEPRAAVEEAIVELAGLVMTDALKAVADLRRCLADGAPSPAAFATAFQRFLGVLGVLETHAAGGKVDERLHATYLGRRWGMHETGQKEDVRLVELARTSFRTPPDMRISESFYMNAATGHLFVEEHYHLPGEGGFSVGPFPRMLAVNLMTVEPRVHPGAVTLMQYAVAGPPTESDLLQVKKMALDSVGGAVKLYRRVVKTARCPYPVFAVVAPVATSTAGGNVTMQDAEGAAIPLAREASPADCHAAAQICGAGRLHAACGHLVLEEGRLALVPLSLLVEEDASLRLARIR